MQFGDWVKNDDYSPRMASYDFGELKWKAGNKQYRLLGFFQKGHWYALIGCTHKQQRYNPASALDTAAARMKQVQHEVVETVEYDL